MFCHYGVYQPFTNSKEMGENLTLVGGRNQFECTHHIARSSTETGRRRSTTLVLSITGGLHWSSEGSALELGGVCTGAWRGLHWSFGTSRGSRGSSPLPEGSSLPGNLHCAVAEGVFTVTSRQGDLTSRRGHHCEVFPWSS